MRIGFTTGSVHEHSDVLGEDTIDFFRKLGCNAIEISALKFKELDRINTISKEDLEGFQYVSLHAPSSIYDQNSKDIMEKLANAQQLLGFDTIVFHADQIKDINILKEYNLPFAIENTDNSRSFGTNAADMDIILNKANSLMILDVLHAYSIEKNFDICNEMIKRFHDKIKQIHISGYNHNMQKRHTCLYKDGPKELIDLMPMDKPIIIESTGSFDELKKEWEYIRERLDKRD